MKRLEGTRLPISMKEFLEGIEQGRIEVITIGASRPIEWVDTSKTIIQDETNRAPASPLNELYEIIKGGKIK